MAEVTYTDEQLERGREKLRRARAWRLKNPHAWAFADLIAQQDARECRHVGGQQLVEAIRNRDFTDEDGKPTTTNNDFAPIIARWLIAAHPGMAACIERRASVFDVLMQPINEGEGGEHAEL